MRAVEGLDDVKQGHGDPEPEPSPPASPLPSVCCSGDDAARYELYYGRSPMPSRSDWRTYIYLGAQSAYNSDGAMTVEARTMFKRFGLGLRATSYFQQLDPKLNTYVHLDLWSLGLVWRVDHVENFKVWLELAATGMSDQRGRNTGGMTAGVHLWRALSREVSMVGGARVSCFERGVTAGELHAGVKLAILQIAYRIVDFDLGPPLHGPEVGVAVTF